MANTMTSGSKLAELSAVSSLEREPEKRPPRLRKAASAQSVVNVEDGSDLSRFQVAQALLCVKTV